ncbi:uncharacterized protein LOC113761758 isoform X2 [Coffea eugenioides]|uniref:Uncharacterized protein isoform X2 n=1 Tax=Coffea arabica TaxID=13443 RepID=A0A6P6WE18_COFAR|nr:uncharacterized protein LOC113731683 isoform X2 [Coffea arabica]XP_027160679.1 uncharacterized protein LOC113761758 isoform X2 [Coffea eugenioides]
MSLSLLQGYSSEEEEEEEEKAEEFDYYDSDDGGKRRNDQVSDNRYKPLFDPNPSSSSSLPSAFDAFSEVSGPPEFLNNSVEEAAKDDDGQKRRHSRRRNRRDKSDLPVGAVVEAKAQLVGIHERVRSDFEGNIPRTSPSHSAEDAKRTTSASNLNENAAELMRFEYLLEKTIVRWLLCVYCPLRVLFVGSIFYMDVLNLWNAENVLWCQRNGLSSLW